MSKNKSYHWNKETDSLTDVFPFQDTINFVFSALTPKMPILECMYIKQAIDLLQVDKTSLFLSVILSVSCAGMLF